MACLGTLGLAQSSLTLGQCSHLCCSYDVIVIFENPHNCLYLTPRGVAWPSSGAALVKIVAALPHLQYNPIKYLVGTKLWLLPIGLTLGVPAFRASLQFF